VTCDQLGLLSICSSHAPIVDTREHGLGPFPAAAARAVSASFYSLSLWCFSGHENHPGNFFDLRFQVALVADRFD
jgi:hypothetical protein